MTHTEAQAATGARLLRAHRLPAQLRVVTDTRTLERGDTFLALRGEHFDGHAFVEDAVARGASALVVDDPASVPGDIPALVVTDTKAAYLALAAAARRAIKAPVIAITGSTGKTTTKDFLAHILRAAGIERVVATPGNENNELGVSKLLLGVPADAGAVVIEFGARHYGDIATLVEIAQPDLAVLTNVGDAHLGVMGSAERLAETKWSIFSGGVTAVVNAGDAVSRERAASLPREPYWFDALSAGEALQFGGEQRVIVRGREELLIAGPGGVQVLRISCALDGDYNRANAAAACAAALVLGCEPQRVAQAVAGLHLPKGRYERTRIGDVELIFDAYNASMAGTLATLETFASERAGRRIVVLASMAELGDGAATMHERVGAAAVHADLEALLVGGTNASDLERGARAAGIPRERLVRFERNADAVKWLALHARAGDLVLLKGSRMYHLEEIVEGLREVRSA